MLGMLSFLFLLCAVAFVLSTAFLIVRTVKKQPKKLFVIMTTVSFVLAIGLTMPISSLYEPNEKPSTGITPLNSDSPSMPETLADADNLNPESITDVALGESDIDADANPPTKADTSSAESDVDTEKAEREQAEKEQAEREKEAQEKAEKEAQEKAEKEAQEKAAREQAKKEKAAKEKSEKEQQEKSKKEIKKVSKLKFDGESIIDSTVSFMKEYEYVKDVYIEAKEDEKEINITVQVPSATDFDVAKMAGEDTARYLASLAAYANSYYEVPGVDSIGSLYDRYSLLIYIDDGYGNFNIYGAKVTTAKNITWRY